jgi:pimeloyl-ACP methyl ester carboxylesterase
MPGKLIVVVPAIRSQRKYWDLLINERLRQEPELNEADWFFWDHRVGFFSFKMVEALARDLNAQLEAKHSNKNYNEIILIGHSLGGLIVRAAYLMCVDTSYGAAGTSAWGEKVSRIILLAAVNKGVPPKKIPFWFISLPLVNFIGIFKKLMVTDLWVGSAFVTNLRIGWIRYFGSDQPRSHPIIIQLLGTADGLVSREDSIDVVQFRNAEHISVPGANHQDLYRLDLLNDEVSKNERYSIIRRVIISELPSEKPSMITEEKNLVVFILPGIRDASSSWTTELGDRIVATRPSTKVEIANYGYFSAAKFFLPWVRRKNVRIFQDQYSDSLAKNPSAEFNCISHSNGSYILGRSLQRLPKMKFNRIFLAGSVLPEDYDWRKCFHRGQVFEVRNDRASKDWPVAMLCKGMRGLGMKDVGVGGFDGFQFPVIENHFYDGGHGEAIQPSNHPVIVDYILKGQKQVRLQGVVSALFRIVSNLSPWVVKFLALSITAWIFISIYLILNNPIAGYYTFGSGAILLLVFYIILDII